MASRQRTSTGTGSDGLQGLCYGEVVLPTALETVGEDSFDGCPEVKTIWVENSSIADSLRRAYKYKAIFLDRQIMVGNKLLWELRGQKELAIPDGVQTIER